MASYRTQGACVIAEISWPACPRLPADPAGGISLPGKHHQRAIAPAGGCLSGGLHHVVAVCIGSEINWLGPASDDGDVPAASSEPLEPMFSLARVSRGAVS